jgi:hypothetical protein
LVLLVLLELIILFPIFISFLFGIFLGNLDELKNNKYIQKLKPEILNKEVHKFKELVTEAAFLVRSLFFLLFGFLIQTKENVLIIERDYLLNDSTVMLESGKMQKVKIGLLDYNKVEIINGLSKSSKIIKQGK